LCVGQLVALCAAPLPAVGGAACAPADAAAAGVLAAPSALLTQQQQQANGGGGGARDVFAAALPCLGLGYVRHFDAARGVLHVLSPLPLRAVAAAVALVAWGGAADVPATLMFRAAPEGDPFCFHPATVAAGAGGGGGAAPRKNLKRRRLEGGAA